MGGLINVFPSAGVAPQNIVGACAHKSEFKYVIGTSTNES